MVTVRLLFCPCSGYVTHIVPALKDKGENMKISIEKNLIEFEPETDAETAMMESLWQQIVDCAKFNKKLVPVGEYIPQKRNLARFAVED